jgi:hypothetical protein
MKSKIATGLRQCAVLAVLLCLAACASREVYHVPPAKDSAGGSSRTVTTTSTSTSTTRVETIEPKPAPIEEKTAEPGKSPLRKDKADDPLYERKKNQ